MECGAFAVPEQIFKCGIQSTVAGIHKPSVNPNFFRIWAKIAEGLAGGRQK